MILLFVKHLALIALAAAGAAWLVSGYGPGFAGLWWAVGAALACGLGVLLLYTSPVGRVNWRNRTASYLVPWGVRVGGGKLWPIPAVSWAVWMSVWAAAAALTPGPGTEPLPWWEVAERVLLGFAWAVDGLALGHMLATRQRFSPGSRSGRTLTTLAAVVAGMIAVSVPLHLIGPTPVALIVAGGPPLVVGGGYSLFLAAVLIFGRGGRWN